MKQRRIETEKIPFTDERFTYYYQPEDWKQSMTGDGPIIKTSTLNAYVDIWYLKLTRLQWYSERGPNNGIAGFKIWGKDWEIQEMIDLYSPTKDSKIELIQLWEFPEDDYTITLINIGEKNPEAIGADLVHAFFLID